MIIWCSLIFLCFDMVLYIATRPPPSRFSTNISRSVPMSIFESLTSRCYMNLGDHKRLSFSLVEFFCESLIKFHEKWIKSLVVRCKPEKVRLVVEFCGETLVRYISFFLLFMALSTLLRCISSPCQEFQCVYGFSFTELIFHDILHIHPPLRMYIHSLKQYFLYIPTY